MHTTLFRRTLLAVIFLFAVTQIVATIRLRQQLAARLKAQLDQLGHQLERESQTLLRLIADDTIAPDDAA